MQLETASGIACDEVTEAELIEAFRNDADRGEFIILSRADMVFIQAAGEGQGPYTLEYRRENGDHFQCTADLSKDRVQVAFFDYLKGKPDWQTGFQWERLETKPWWKFW